VTYHVDLLLDDERRSASPINIGMLLRMAAFAAVAALVFVFAMLWIECRNVEMRVAAAKADVERQKPAHDEWVALQRTLGELRGSMRQAEAFRKSQLKHGVGAELAQLQLGVPPEMQLTMMRITQAIDRSGPVATRTYEMRIEGRLTGDGPKDRVDETLRYLSTAPFYADHVRKVEVPQNTFRKESVRVPGQNEPRVKWSFAILCHYQPRSFE
jgi:hypothetical protein